MANKNPSPETRFASGQSGNPGGKTSETKRLELANAEAAMRIRARLLQAVENTLGEEQSDAQAMELIEAAMLKLLTDSETRGLGAPQQQVNGDIKTALTIRWLGDGDD